MNTKCADCGRYDELHEHRELDNDNLSTACVTAMHAELLEDKLARRNLERDNARLRAELEKAAGQLAALSQKPEPFAPRPWCAKCEQRVARDGSCGCSIAAAALAGEKP